MSNFIKMKEIFFFSFRITTTTLTRKKCNEQMLLYNIFIEIGKYVLCCGTHERVINLSFIILCTLCTCVIQFM